MKWFRDISIKTKIAIAITLVSTSVTMVFMSFLLFHEVSELKYELRERVSLSSRLVAEYMVSPLSFYDSTGGREILAKIKTVKSINEAIVFDSTGSQFAYVNIHKLQLLKDHESPAAIQQTFANQKDYLLLSLPIVMNEQKLGNLFILASYERINSKLQDRILLFAALLLASTVLSFFLAYYSAGLVSKPILKLARFTRTVAANQDYSIRVKHEAQDEISMLYKNFNHMLEQIEQRQKTILERKQALEISEAKYKHIFENSLVGIMKVDYDSDMLLESNRFFKRIFKLFKNEPFRFSDYILSKNEYYYFKDRLKNKEVVQDYELQYKTKTGKSGWILVSAKYYRDGNYFEGVVSEITNEKEIIKALEIANEELDNFVYHASHDLRSPLKSILGIVEVIKLEKPTDGVVNLTDMIKRSVLKLDKLVANLLAISRNNRIDKKWEVVDLGSLIDEVLESLSYLKEFSRIQVIKDYNQNEVFVSDKVRISMIMNNFISNAIKYQRKSEQSPYIRISFIITKTDCTIEVTDNGEGIVEEYQSKIFKMFFRATESSDGSGLGLYIVKNAVSNLKGTVSFVSEPMKITTFKVVIPNRLDLLKSAQSSSPQPVLKLE